MYFGRDHDVTATMQQYCSVQKSRNVRRMQTMRTVDSRLKLKSECFAINRLQLLEHEYQNALRDIEKEQVSFSILSDVCLPVSLLFLIVVWGYQLNTMTVDTEISENRTMLLVYSVGLIVISGTACVYIAIRMRAMPSEKSTANFLPGETKPLKAEQKLRPKRFYYQTIPEIHRAGRKPTDIFIV